MSAKMEISCSKFQPNMFNKSRCQNCFKSRELHPMTDEEFEQAKPIYASWLCLAPEGTDFDNPMHRSRKWQRRFFILYEHGRLQFSLDELPSTIPQGILDLGLCTEVIDAEARTGQKNTLCIITPEQEIFIRGDSKEMINGWSEQLIVFLQINKQNQRNIGEMSSVQSQDKALTKKAMCGIGAPDVGAGECDEPYSPEQHDGQRSKAVDMSTVCDENVAAFAFDSLDSGTVQKSHQMCSMDTGADSSLHPQLVFSCPSPEPWSTECDSFSSANSLPLPDSTLSRSISSFDSELQENTYSNVLSGGENLLSTQTMESERSVYQHCEECDREDSCFTTARIESDCLSSGKMCLCSRRRGRSRSQTCAIQSYNKEISAGFLEAPQISLHPRRRARSLDGRASDSSMVPDLLNFKKGWLLTLDDNEQWRKYWFVLSAHSLNFYHDSGTEEASELVGEIDMTACYKVTEHLVQRNYGFQLHTHKTVYTLAAVTAGIRQNWIQVLTKNIQGHDGPDVASLADNHLLQMKAQCGPDVTQDSRCCTEQESSHEQRHGCGAKTLDQNKIGQTHQMIVQEGSREQEWLHVQTEDEQKEQGSRRRAREERRQRYAFVMGSACSEERSSEDDQQQQQQQQQQQMMMREIEERWLQVERTFIRDGKKVPLYPECQSRSTIELEQNLEHDQKKEPTHLGIPCTTQKMELNKQNPVLTLTEKYQETKQLLQLENLRRQHIKDQLNFCPLPQLSSEFLTEPEMKTECNVMNCETTLNKSSLGSHIWYEASRDWEDEHSRAKVDGFSERAVLSVRKNVGSDPALVERFSQENGFLARQHESLNRHNQELLNQLAEANREIDKLKAVLLHQQNGCQPDLESAVECLEMELARTSRALQEAQNQLAEMEERLTDTRKTLQLREATLRGLGFLTKDSDERLSKLSSPVEINRSCPCLGVQENKLSELDSQVCPSEQICRELELVNSQRILEAEEKTETMQREPQFTMSSEWESWMHKSRQQEGWRSREGIQHVVEESVRRRSSELSMLLGVIKHLAGNEEQDSCLEHENTQVDPIVVQGLQLEKNIWESFVNSLKDDLSQGMGTDGAGCLLQCVKKKLQEINMDLMAFSVSTGNSNPRSLSRDSDPHNLNAMHLTNFDNESFKEQQKEKTIHSDEQLSYSLIWKGLKTHVEKRLALLNHIESKLKLSINSDRNYDLWDQTEFFCLDPFVSAAMDIFTACLISHYNAHQKRTLPITEQSYCNIKPEIQATLHERTLRPNNLFAHEKTEANKENETETVNTMRSRIKELEYLLSRGTKTIASQQQQHDEDKTRLKMEIVSAYEQGFTLLKECHQKLKEDLILKYQRDLEHLQEEKDRLLAEEVAATLAVIEALKRAHSSEMERVLQKANWVKSNGDMSIAEMLKSHSEELASVQRELDALSMQYSQKCLENVHLAQALEMERNALQHSRHQNIALSTRNQELYNHFAEEIIRLSSTGNVGTSELGESRQSYELEIMLRVKESEVEYLKQEIRTLEKEFESSQMDQKLVTEIQTDLSMVNEKAEQQIGQLGEHLRLVYEALAESMEEKTCTAILNAAHNAPLKS